ncbi:MAG: hypothetical protein JNL58_31615, partial [Planctomyces sp.]|nr:hypothetical protein [Planctomyces sp.]
MKFIRLSLAIVLCLSVSVSELSAQVVIRGEVVYTMDGPPIRDGIVVIRDGKISQVGPATEVVVPEGVEVLTGKVVTPGLIDSHSVVGLSGIFNVPADQDQLEKSTPVQPELRAIDAFNADEELLDWIRGFGVTTIHTGHAPGELISGQTMIVKTTGTLDQESLLKETAAVAVTLSSEELKEGGKPPGTRGKSVAMLRSELIRAREYSAKQKAAADKPEADRVARDLRLEVLSQVLNGEIAFMVTADKAQDIQSALRIADEFDLRLWLDSGSESFLVMDQLKAAKVPVLVHPTMARAVDVRENLSFETAGRLRNAGITVCLQSGFEAYVPKTRVVLFEAGMAAANGLSFEQ